MNGFKTFLNKWFRPTEGNDSGIGLKQYLVVAFFSILILIFTFPAYYPEIHPGFDGSEFYVFNYLFYHHIQFGTRVVFTYGPLGFLSSPSSMGNNLLIGIIFSNIIRFIFIYSFLFLGYLLNTSNRILYILLVIGVCNMMYIDMIFPGVAILVVLIYHIRKKIAWLIIGCMLAAWALLVKSSYGLMCISILLSYSFYIIFLTKRIAVLLYVLLFASFSFLFTWLLLYHNLNGVFTYFHAMYEFSKDNSNAYQLNVANHWGLLGLALILFYIPLFLNKNELTRVLYLISIASLYAAFKYSFAREENWHELFLFDFIILVCALLIALNNNLKPLILMFPLAAISLLYSNMILTNTYSAGTYAIGANTQITGVDNFIGFVINYNDAIKTAEATNTGTLQTTILDRQQRALIGNNTVDCYPMELTYVAADTLNWDPRPNLQILSYTPWLDEHNASFFSSGNAPVFYIWQLERPPSNNYSLDNHYLLNEEPKSIFEFLTHYQLINTTEKTALFKHVDNHLLSEEHITGTTTGYLDKWLDVTPSDTISVIRARIHFQHTFKGILRKTFYKDELYFIDYMLKDGTVKSYRFVPGNAISGLWINPLIIDITKGLKGGQQVKSIRIHVSERGCIENNFPIDWTAFHTL